MQIITDEIYCRECGCRIGTTDDLGCRESYIERIPVGLIGQYREVEKEFIVCRGCTDEEERAWEEFQKTPEYQYERSFNKWCEEYAQ